MRQIVLIFLCFAFSGFAQNRTLSNELSRIDNMISAGKQDDGINRLYQMRDSITSIPNFEIPAYISVVNSLIAYLPAIGQLAELDKVVDEAITLCNNREDSESFLAYLYAAKSQMYGDLLDYNRSVYNSLEGLRLCEKINRRDLVYILLLGNAANAYSAMGDYLSSKLYADEAMSEIESNRKNLEDNVILNIYGFLLNNSAMNYYKMGKLDDAEFMFRKVLELEDIKNRPDSPYLYALNNLAATLLFQYKYQDAIEILDMIPETNYRTSLFKAENTLTAHVMLNDSEASNALKRYSETQRKTLCNVLGSFSESEREAFIGQRMRELSTIPNWTALQNDNPSMRITAFNDNLFARSANSILSHYIDIKLDSTPEIKAIRDSVVSKDFDSNRRAEWLNKLEKAENNILRANKDIENFISENISDFYETKSLLGPDDAFILFCYTPKINNFRNTISGYGAYIIKSDYAAPELIFLCDVDSVENIFFNSEPDAEFISNLYSYENGQRMYDKIWSNVEPYIKRCNNIYYSVTGPLATVNFDAFVTPDKRRLRDIYNLQLISNPKYISQNRNLFNEELSLIAFGAPSFNLSSEEMTLVASRYPNFSGIDITENISLRGDVLRGNWLELPATRREVETIRSLVCQNGGKVQVFIDNDACEEAFKSMDGHSPHIIHVATHGFVISTDNQYENSTFAQSFGGISEKGSYMLWTGLVFAGGNNTWNGRKSPFGTEDGILTADEISRMDLSHTDLVVLSACETACGHIDPVEGVWGLQRAFKDAGVNTILMTLWKIPDATTALFMERFYSELAMGHTPHESLRIAQNYLINNGISDPFYWAPFVILD